VLAHEAGDNIQIGERRDQDLVSPGP
jgi:hypothetical protein